MLEADPNEIEKMKKQKEKEAEDMMKNRNYDQNETYEDLHEFNPGEDLVNFKDTKFTITKSSASHDIEDIM